MVVRVECSAGFYVRSLAHDLGERLGTGAHLVGLRRTRSGDYGLSEAIPIDAIERDRDAAVAGFVPLASMLPRLPFVVLTPEGSHDARGTAASLARTISASSRLPADVGGAASTHASPERGRSDGFGCSRRTAGSSDWRVRWRVPVFCIPQLF